MGDQPDSIISRGATGNELRNQSDSHIRPPVARVRERQMSSIIGIRRSLPGPGKGSFTGQPGR